MSKKQIIWISVAAVALIALILGGIFIWKGYFSDPSKITKNITFTVIDKDGNATEHAITTKKVYLGEALAEAELVEYVEDGRYDTVAGITVNWDVNKSYWLFTKNGKGLHTGINDITIKNKQSYEATYKVAK